jgi:hypothetical protein
MQRSIGILLAATVNVVTMQSASHTIAQERPGNQTLQEDVLLPPHVERVGVRASLVYWGMSADSVERIMGTSAESEAYEGLSGNVRVFHYRLEPIATKVTFSNGKVSGLALDIAGIDERALPPYSRSAWPGMHRSFVLQMLGGPAEDRFFDRFGVKLEHMIFERPGEPDVSIFFMGERVVTKKVGRSLPPDVLGFSLPLALDPAKEETDARGPAHIKERIRVGMMVRDVQALFGTPRLRVPYSFKGRPAEYALYETAQDGSFGRFTFIDGVLCEFEEGGRIPLDQILNGG